MGCVDALKMCVSTPLYTLLTFVEPHFIGDIAESYLRQFATKDEADRMYGLYVRKGQFYIGNKLVVINENNIVFEDEEYEGTPGL